jgi:hypothetical protein
MAVKKMRGYWLRVSKVEENEHCCRVSPLTLHGNTSPYKVNEEVIPEKHRYCGQLSKLRDKSFPILQCYVGQHSCIGLLLKVPS